MPFIDVKLNVKLDELQKETLKSSLGKLIKIIPGKSENYLMVQIEDDLNIYFKGSSEPAIYIEVKVFKEVESKYLNKFSEVITKEISSLTNINPNRIYISYFFTNEWGYEGHNF